MKFVCKGINHGPVIRDSLWFLGSHLFMASLQRKTARCLPAKTKFETKTKDQSTEFRQLGSDVIPCLAEPVK